MNCVHYFFQKGREGKLQTNQPFPDNT